MRFICFVLFLLSTITGLCQPSVVHKYGDSIVYHNRHISLGAKHSGIGFGNFIHYSGIKLSFLDKDTLTNGISIALSQRKQPKKTNGIELGGNITTSEINGAAVGILNTVYVKLNGGSLAVLYNYNWRLNGVAISGVFQMSDYLKGISIGGLADIHHSSKGLVVAGAYESTDSLYGVGIGGIAIHTDDFRGITIAAINSTITGHGLQIGIINQANGFRGVQIGLINYNKDKKHLKVLPFVNVN